MDHKQCRCVSDVHYIVFPSQELQRVIDHDRKLRDFMSRKNQERSEAHDEMETRKLRKEAEKASTREKTVMVSEIWRGEGGSVEAIWLPEYYYTIMPLLWQNSQVSLIHHVLSVQSYEQAFEKIKDATGITDIDQLVSKFIEGMQPHQ